MKSEPWIDKVYQENPIPLPELNYAHWQQAEAMIINQEKNKKKKRIIFWLFLSAFTIALVLGVFYFSTYSSPAISPLEKIENKELIKEETLPSIAQMSTTEKLTGNTTHSTKEDDHLVNNANKLNDKTTSDALVNASSTKDINFTTKSLAKNRNSSMQSKSSVSATSRSDQKNAYKDLVNMISSDLEYHNNKSNNTVFDEKEKASIRNQNAHLLVNALPNFIVFLQVPNRSKVIQIYSEVAMAAPIIVKKMTWREKGIRMALAQHVDPYTSNTAISYANAELFFQKQISNKWFYGLSMGYKSHFNKTQYAQVITEYKYQGFSAAINNFGIKPEWIQSLSMQINSGLDIKKNRLSIGLNPEMILASKGVVNKLQFKDLNGVKILEEANVNDVNSGWLNTQVLNKLSFSGFLAYDVKINKRFSLGLQFNKILYSPYKPLASDFVQKNISNWNSGFRISYSIK